ncbi:class I SAM-dependent methyltransferase [Massilia sp. W12]|uniref:class I SAM-dependent methyltransferase n=1 Tax=Massilia sp. W12 TaxID=3126507 RepID=UPI0030CD2E93
MQQSSLVSQQFGNQAQAYLRSAVHAQGAELQRMTDLARASAALHALDLGCGAGHVSFALAAGGATVTAYDVSPKMLEVVGQEAQRRACRLSLRQGQAERLPFADASFDLVASRFSAHHWEDVPAALAEVRRVLKPGGQCILVDVIAPPQPLFDTVLQTVEILRDPSHVRDYSASQWREMALQAGLACGEFMQWKLTMVFDVWIARMNTSLQRADAIRDVFDQAAQEVRSYFNVQPDYSWDMDVMWLAMTAP